MKFRIGAFFRWLGIGLATVVAAVLLLLGYWYFRPNTARQDAALGIESWPAVADGMHNSNTDMVFWRGSFYLVHASSRYHMGNSATRLVLRRSTDAKTWEEISALNVGGEDIRDPKLAVIDDRLFMYALKNVSFEPEPYATVLSTSSDGENWTAFKELEPKGWLFWKPKTLDGQTWYTTAYWHEHGRSILLTSPDGENWTEVSEIYEGDRNDETALEFLPDGRMLVTARLEGNRSSWHQGAADAATLLAVAAPPYTSWTKTKSFVTRLDGPALFSYQGRVYAVGRYDPEGYDQWYGMSSLLGRKRTALYAVTPDQLIHLSDLPSSGDTSYPGVVLKDGLLYASYYTNNIQRDPPWLMGLILPSDIRIVVVDLAIMEQVAFKRE